MKHLIIFLLFINTAHSQKVLGDWNNSFQIFTSSGTLDYQLKLISPSYKDLKTKANWDGVKVQYYNVTEGNYNLNVYMPVNKVILQAIADNISIKEALHNGYTYFSPYHNRLYLNGYSVPLYGSYKVKFKDNKRIVKNGISFKEVYVTHNNTTYFCVTRCNVLYINRPDMGNFYFNKQMWNENE